jgi:hypothetical protein
VEPPDGISKKINGDGIMRKYNWITKLLDAIGSAIKRFKPFRLRESIKAPDYRMKKLYPTQEQLKKKKEKKKIFHQFRPRMKQDKHILRNENNHEL